MSGRQLPAAFCLRFSRPIIFSSAAIKKLSKIASVQLNVEGSYNLYQYLLNESEVGICFLYFFKTIFCIFESTSSISFRLSQVGAYMNRHEMSRLSG